MQARLQELTEQTAKDFEKIKELEDERDTLSDKINQMIAADQAKAQESSQRAAE